MHPSSHRRGLTARSDACTTARHSYAGRVSASPTRAPRAATTWHVWLYGGYGRDLRASKREEEEEERGITVHTKIPYAAIGLQLGPGNVRRRAWRISRSTRIVMADFKIDE